MGLKFDIVYHPDVVEKDIHKLSPSDKNRVKKAIEDKLTISPEIFGKPLRRSLKGYRKLRVGDYRVIYRIEGKMVKIFYIGHRSIVYKKLDNGFNMSRVYIDMTDKQLRDVHKNFHRARQS